MIKNLLVSFLCLIPFLSFAEIVSVDEAEKVAYHFFDKGHSNLKNSEILPLKLVCDGDSKRTRNAVNDVPAFYVFNRGENQGFIIISGDDVVKPVLAYSFEGCFTTDEMPENMKGWLSYVQNEISYLRKQDIEPSEEIQQKWDNLKSAETVIWLKTPKWNQNMPYWDKTPNNYYTGCTITATAIVMGYHKWPDAGVGELKGYTQSDNLYVPGVTLGHPYYWDKMPYINGNALDLMNDEQRDAVSTLMRDVGVMLRAKYSMYGTSAKPTAVEFKLPRHMKYNDKLFYIERNNFTDNGWFKLLKHELDNNRPIVYAGYGPEEGHSFVLDGYDSEDFFHVNWGWGGSSNGFYSLDNMNPYDQGPGATSDIYNLDQEAVLRILPTREGSEIEYFEYITFTKTNYVGKGLQLSNPEQKIAQGETIEVTAGRYCNLGSDAYNGVFKLAITDAYGAIKKELYTTPERYLKQGSGTMPLDELRDKIQITLEDPIAEGDRIRLVYKSRDGKWKPVVCEDPNAQWEIILKGDNTTGIENITVDKKKDAPIYDIMGRRVINPVKGGFYIQNGKKFIAK